MHSIAYVGPVREAISEPASASLTFEGLFADYAGLVWRTLRFFGVAEPDLEDQLQEVFLVVHRRLAQCDAERPHA